MKKQILVGIMIAITLYTGWSFYNIRSKQNSEIEKLYSNRSVILKSDYFVKNIKINGFSVEWHEYSGSSEIIKVEAGTHTLEYTTYSVNGFGHHLNERTFKKKVEVTKYDDTFRVMEIDLD